MKLTVQRVMDATLVISQIIREQRQMPQKGKYRLARMHAKLMPEFTTINEQRNDLIKAYDHHEMIAGPAPADAGQPQELVPSPEFSVPVDKMPEFTEAWEKIGATEIDVDVEPIPLEQLDLGGKDDGAIQANELITLGDLVIE